MRLKSFRERRLSVGKDPAGRARMRVGSELKAARKKAGLTVEVISKRTKISVSKLVALEKNDFTNLPTGLYLFSAVRAYAREVHIDPEPIVERLRADFADRDTLDALQALDASGALDAKNLAHAGRSRERSSFLRNVSIAAGVLLIAAAGAGGGAYLLNINRSAPVERSSSVPSPAPAMTVASSGVPQPAASAVGGSAPPKTRTARSRTTAVVPELQETVAAVDAVLEEPAAEPANSEALGAEVPAATAP